MTKTQLTALRQLRDKGYAIAIFTPEELSGAPVDDIEDRMVSEGWDAIDMLKEEDNND